MPWGQQINLPDSGALVIGRSTQAFGDDPRAKECTQVSREHARFFRDEAGELMVLDLRSLNGTYIDGMPVPVEGNGTPVTRGQTLRLGQDVSCEVVALDEFGEPKQ
jgi:pSer/pThr/pTyr-binding forkhead associated (FHA) protein